MIKTRIQADIRVYYCRNSEYAGGVPAAISKLGLLADVFVEPVPCAGRIDPRYMLKAFESGARAVCVLACCAGHCRMFEGNLRATRRVNAVRQLLSEAGLDSNAARIFVPESFDQNTLDAAVATVAGPAPRKCVEHTVGQVEVPA